MFLPDAIGDPKRRKGEEKIRPPTDILVYAEGVFDCAILRLVAPGKRIKITLPPQRKQYTGKPGILRLLKQSNNQEHAVVDMDYDFSGTHIAEFPNVRDTRFACCLLSYLIGDRDLSQSADHFGKKLFPKDTNKRKRFKKAFTENWPFLHAVTMERTAARLFRGKYGNSRKVKIETKGKPPTLEMILGQGKKCIGDLISTQNQQAFVNFKRKYATKLKCAGFNDHALEEVLIPFIAHFEPSLSHSFIKSKFSQALEIYLLKTQLYKKGGDLLPLTE